MTSHDVVGRMRRVLGTRRIGHAGTLDPMATGVLVLGVNRATRLLHYLVGADKTYRATIRLGITTSTEDAEGQVERVCSPAKVSHEQLVEVVSGFCGDVMQVPSAVSAIKVDGKRAYARVRAGEHVELAPRPVRIDRFEVDQVRTHQLDSGDVVTDCDVVIDCSSGTYIRAVARDVGDELGVGGHLIALRRTRVGNYDLEVATPLPEVEDPVALMSLGDAGSRLFPVRELSESEAGDLSFGKFISRNPDDPAGSKTYPVGGFGSDGALIALLEGDGEIFRPTVVFAPAGSN